jgi:hypothetical protein
VRTLFCWTTFHKAEAVLRKASALSGELVNKDELNKAGSKVELLVEEDNDRIIEVGNSVGGGRT